MKVLIILFTIIGCNKYISKYSYRKFKDLNSDLIEAIERNEEEKVEELLKKGANANFRLSIGITPLLVACSKSSLKIVKLLLDKGASINIIDDFGNSPLLKAYERLKSSTSSNEELEIVKILLEKGADLNLEDRMGISCSENLLILAVSKGDINFLKFLMDRGANIGQISSLEKCSISILLLLSAIQKSDLDMVKFLLKKKINFKYDYSSHYSLITSACCQKEMKILNLLIKKKFRIEDEEFRTNKRALIYVLDSNLLQACEVLINSGAEVVYKNSNYNPLLSACRAFKYRKNNLNIIKLLLERGASLDLGDEYNSNCWEMFLDINPENIEEYKELLTLLLTAKNFIDKTFLNNLFSTKNKTLFNFVVEKSKLKKILDEEKISNKFKKFINTIEDESFLKTINIDLYTKATNFKIEIFSKIIGGASNKDLKVLKLKIKKFMKERFKNLSSEAKD